MLLYISETMKKTKVVCWDVLAIYSVVCLLILTYSAYTRPIASGKDIFNLKFWLSGRPHYESLLALSVMYILAIFQLCVYFNRPILSIFTKNEICSYSLCGTRNIPWTEISSLEITEIKNSRSGKSELFKYFSVAISASNERNIVFGFESFSTKKMNLILKMREYPQFNQ